MWILSVCKYVIDMCTDMMYLSRITRVDTRRQVSSVRNIRNWREVVRQPQNTARVAEGWEPSKRNSRCNSVNRSSFLNASWTFALER